jgi:cytochrome c-type biogenesis protein CcmH/NrfG
MTLAAGTGRAVSAACVTLLLLLPLGAWAREAASSSAERPPAALERDYERCRVHADVDACYDALRRNPRDPTLLVALGDDLLRAKRPADAIRAYRRAAALDPGLGVAAKMSAAQEMLSSPRASGKPQAAAREGPVQRYSNAAPTTQSH